MTRRPLIYIAGAGHSGSTLLEMFVSGAKGHVGLGEIFQLVDRRNPIIDNLDGHQCSCGKGVAECPFWGKVVELLRTIPREDENRRYAALGDGFAARFGAGAVMVDSSKAPEGLERAAQSGAFDIRVLHLVRDVRSWLVSMQKSYARNNVATLGSNVQRHGLLKGTAKFAARNPLFDARQWQRINAEVEQVVVRYDLPVLPVRYERLCFDSEAVRTEIERFIGAEIAPYGDASARGDNHSIFGNRMRFEPEKLAAIRYDDGWLRDNRWMLAWALLPGVRRMNARLGGTQEAAR
ncbi:hypothetical protein OZN62_11675 [Aurantiacibacter sp. MUD11]|uniref:hypothetical protein n=1 Tax=Aurantiacibacter sp. MUD11 TaxID=3003265 RepID=UPI0022AA3660|nr:hypothetical protein [Aurantiacibacter sp. MUD11]WAT17572.1 hypothetical protein OZN62_11675 [Aurantiacibacter sp. MUD11]